MKRSYAQFYIAAILIINLTACSQGSNVGIDTEQSRQTTKTERAQESTIEKIEDGYPAGSIFDSYPVSEENQQENVYPVHNPIREYGPSFTIDEFIDPNVITGTGPSGVPIKLVDVTMMGEVLALTTIDETGNFVFHVDKPLKSGHAIGLMIGDLSKTEFNYDEFSYSDEYIEKPMIGTLFIILIVP
jgi:hypothetical protein